ncbi:DegT/DnrJ/EryC1/StrS family aminotransferase [Sphaerimonospora mesophila]|uniref:DegT/DnrJ/EryC1/StrS family aminotransferase n=1 Tax=Sphaerimonospora mesophila TaxID=37483 RepID=UPI003D750A0A
MPAFTARRAEIAATCTRALTDLPGLTTPTVPPGVHHGRFLYSIFIDPDSAPFTRDQVAEHVRAEYAIGTSRHFEPVHMLRVHRGAGTHPLPDTETAPARRLSPPSHPAMTAHETDRVSSVHALWNRRP